MSAPRYDSYRESGVEWVGGIPTHWVTEPLWTVADECDRPNVGMIENNLLSLSYGRIVRKDVNNNDGLLPASFETYQIVEPDDVVWRLTDLQNDKRSLRTARVPERGIITSAYLATRPHRIDSRYFSYLLRAYDLMKVFYSMGGGLRQGMKFADVRRLPILLPPPPEQAAIAAFLERETGKIDALVEAQTRLIELLKEKRQAVISHAVTKGLDPAAPMKDSGVEWLGQVPAHWRVRKIKQVAEMESGHTPDRKIAAYWENCDIPWVSLHDTGYLKDHDYITETAQSVNPLGIANSSARLLPARAVVFSRDATIGRCAIITRPMAVSQHFIAWLCSDDLEPEYLLFCLRSMAGELERLSSGATLKTIGMPQVRALAMPLPSREEQLSIVTTIQTKAVALDAMIADVQAAVTLLQERRAALISAAVTGKIDVRGLAPERAEAA